MTVILTTWVVVVFRGSWRDTWHLTPDVLTAAQVVEMSVTNNSVSKDYPHRDNHAKQITDSPGFKPFTICAVSQSKFLECPVSYFSQWEKRLLLVCIGAFSTKCIFNVAVIFLFQFQRHSNWIHMTEMSPLVGSSCDDTEKLHGFHLPHVHVIILYHAITVQFAIIFGLVLVFYFLPLVY